MLSFSPDFQAFFAELKENNTREWFAENKDRYEKSVKKPMEAFASEMIKSLSAINPALDCDPKSTLYRIHRDVRFGADKRPYKENASMFISENGGGKKGGDPGLYIQLDANGIMVAPVISYMPDKELIFKIRDAIAYQPEAFDKILNSPDFKKRFPNGVEGESNKVMPEEFKELSKTWPILKKKQYYLMAQLGPEQLVSNNLVAEIRDIYVVALPFVRFFTEALNPQD